MFLTSSALFLLLAVALSRRPTTVIADKTADDFDAAINNAFKELKAVSSTPAETERLTKLVAEKADEVTKALNEIEKKSVKNEKNEGVAGLDFSAKNAGAAVKMVVSNVPKLIDGIQKGDWKSIAEGSLGIVASFLYFTGPWGTVAMAILPLLNTIFKLVDGGVPKPEESEEEIIDRVVSAAIERAHLQEFKMELAGVRRLYSTMQQSTAAFRASDKELSRDQASVLYNHVFEELVALGKLADLIGQKCALDLTINPKDEKVMRQVYDCLAFVDLYAELSILRKLVLLDMAALLKDKFEETSDNILEMHRRELKADAELLRFLIDPIDYPTSRFIVAAFYQQRHRHDVTDVFLDTLATVLPQKQSSGVMVCMEEALMGQCYEMTEGKKDADVNRIERKDNDMGGYTGSIMSMFIPLGTQVFAHHEKDKRGIDKDGPFVGMTVITTPFKKMLGALPKGKEKWQSLEIMKTDKDAFEMTKICIASGFDVKLVCDSVDVGEFDLKDYHGAYMLKHFASMNIPEKRKVTLFESEEDKEGVGPFYGPDAIEVVDHPQKDTKPRGGKTIFNLSELKLMAWERIKIEVASPQENARHMVKMCIEDDFNGRCFRIKKGEHKNLYELAPYKKLLTEDYKTFKTNFKIASITIPANMKVTTYSSPDFNGVIGGPYTGLIHLPQVTWLPIRSFKIEDVTSQQPDTQPDEIKTKKQDKNDGGNRKEGIDKLLDNMNQKQAMEERDASSKESLNKSLQEAAELSEPISNSSSSLLPNSSSTDADTIPTDTTAGMTELTGDVSSKGTIESTTATNTTASDVASAAQMEQQTTSKEIEEKADSSYVSEPVKSDKQWNNQIRDQSFREFIKDERPLLGAANHKPGEDLAMRRSATRRESANQLINRVKGKPGNARSMKSAPKKSATLMKLRKEAVREISGIKKELVQLELNSDEETLSKGNVLHAEGWKQSSGIA